MIEIDSADLQSLVAPCAAIAPSRTPLEALTYLRLRAHEGFLYASATNMETYVEARQEIGTTEAFDIYVSAAFFASVVGTLPEGIVTVEVADRIALRQGRYASFVPRYEAAPHPVAPEHPPALTVSVAGSFLTTGRKMVEWACDEKDVARPFFEGVLLRVMPDAIRFVGGQSKVIAEYMVSGATKADTRVDAILPKGVLSVVSKYFTSGEKITMALSENDAVFRSDRLTLTTRLVAGPYAPYEKVFSHNAERTEHTVSVDCVELQRALRMLAPFAERKFSLNIEVSASGALLLSFEGERGRAEQEVAGSYSGDGTLLRIAFDDFSEAVSRIETQRVVLRIGPRGKTIQSPVMISPEYGDKPPAFFTVMLGQQSR